MSPELTRMSRTTQRVEEIRNYCLEASRYRTELLDYFQEQWRVSGSTVAQSIQTALRQGDIIYNGKYRATT